MRALPEGAKANLRAIAEAIFAGPEGPPPAARLDWLMDDVSDFSRYAGRGRTLVRLALAAVSLLAPLFVGSLRPLRTLPLERRVEALARMEKSLLSNAVLAVKAYLCLVYYEHPDAQREVGFVGMGRAAR